MYKLDNCLVVGVSSRALFDLEDENKIYLEQGIKAYSDYQIAHENELLKTGTAFSLVKALLNLNTLKPDERKTEIIIMSHNSADTSLRIFNSINYYKLDITRAALTGGTSLSPYLEAFKTDLFLSASEDDVKKAVRANIAAGVIYTQHLESVSGDEEIKQIKIAFDGDAVLFSDESERIYQEQGIEAFQENERRKAG